MKYIKLLLLFAAVLVLASGCHTTSVVEGPAPGVRVENPPEGVAGVRMNTVAILDDSLQNWYYYENTLTGVREHGKVGKIAVESTNSRRTPTGTLEAWARLRNRTDHDLQLECRIQFFDQQKGPLEGPTPWKRLYLPANSVSTYKESSYHVQGIGYYYIEIREGR
jgi:hypothetical protein